MIFNYFFSFVGRGSVKYAVDRQPRGGYGRNYAGNLFLKIFYYFGCKEQFKIYFFKKTIE